MKLHFSYGSFLNLALEVIDRVSRSQGDQSYEIICKMIGEGLHWDYAEVWLRDPLKPELYLSNISYMTDDKTKDFSLASKKTTFKYGEGLPGIAWKAKEPLWITNLSDSHHFLRKTEAKKAGFKTINVIPILAEDYVDAVLLFFSKRMLEENLQLKKLMLILSFRVGINILKRNLSGILENYRLEASKSIGLISKIFSLRDPYTVSHEIFVRNFAIDMGKELKFSNRQLLDLDYAATLHDIGKIAIPMEILSKPSRLSNEEFNLIKTHVTTGYDLVKDLSFSDNVKMMIHEHHERLDGSGYPCGKKGDAISYGSQLLAVADVVSAMLENRPYRVAHSKAVVIDELQKHANIKYNGQMVDIAIHLLKIYNEDHFKGLVSFD